MNSTIALVDCNNFFVSCERLFRPDLEGKPVVVLSSNDGCVISRSNEAKKLGIPMGAPVFKYNDLFIREGVYCFSANFELYGDISNRITKTLAKTAPLTEVYSVDESFLDITSLKITNHQSWAQAVRIKVLQEVGVPVAIGIASSKTLAKLASERAKKDTPNNTILNLVNIPPSSLYHYMRLTPIEDVWGIGRKLAPKLRAIGIRSALDLSRLDQLYAQQIMGIHGRQTVAELNGQSCLPISPSKNRRQSITHGRIFGEDTNCFNVIEAAITSLVSKATLTLRREGLLANQATVCLQTNRYKPNYSCFVETLKLKELKAPSADPGVISSGLIKAIQPKLGVNHYIHKADIYLNDLIPLNQLQLKLLGINLSGLDSNQARLSAIDRLNDRFGQRTIKLASENLSNNWRPKKKLISPSYTTNWYDLPIIR